MLSLFSDARTPAQRHPPSWGGVVPGGRNTGVAKLTVTALRLFLGFLHLDGVTENARLLLGRADGLAPPAGRVAQGAPA